MLVIENEMVFAVDVDETLIMQDMSRPLKDIVPVLCPYDGIYKYRAMHRPHIRALKNYVARGAHVIVWSKNGPRWAAAVLEALGLDHLTVHVICKPFAYLDDKPVETWIGERLYLHPDDKFGED